MTWVPMQIQVQWFDTNGNPASGYVLKAYEAGTDTNTPMAIDKNGNTTANTITTNSDGFFEVSGNPVIPYIDQDYKWAIYENADDASNNTNAYFGPIDNVPFDVFGSTETTIYKTLFDDFVVDTGGTRALTLTDFGRSNKFTHASAITLTIPASTITEGSGPCIIYYPSDQSQTITVAAATGATVDAETSYSPGSLLAIYRIGSNEFKVGGA